MPDNNPTLSKRVRASATVPDALRGRFDALLAGLDDLRDADTAGASDTPDGHDHPERDKPARSSRRVVRRRGHPERQAPSKPAPAEVTQLLRRPSPGESIARLEAAAASTGPGPVCDELSPEERAAFLLSVLGQPECLGTVSRGAGRMALDGRDEVDALQDLCLRLLEHPAELKLPQHGQSAYPYVRTVVRNAVRDAARAQNRHERILTEAGQLPGHWLSAVRSGEPAEVTALRRVEYADIVKRIASLPRALAEAAALILDGYSVPEIAAVLGISVNAVANRLHRIRSPRIRRALLAA